MNEEFEVGNIYSAILSSSFTILLPVFMLLYSLFLFFPGDAFQSRSLFPKYSEE